MPHAADRQPEPAGRGFSCELVASLTPGEGRVIAELGAVLAHARDAAIHTALGSAPSTDAVETLLGQIEVELDRLRGRLSRIQD